MGPQSLGEILVSHVHHPLGVVFHLHGLAYEGIVRLDAIEHRVELIGRGFDDVDIEALFPAAYGGFDFPRDAEQPALGEHFPGPDGAEPPFDLVPVFDRMDVVESFRVPQVLGRQLVVGADGVIDDCRRSG